MRKIDYYSLDKKIFKEKKKTIKRLILSWNQLTEFSRTIHLTKETIGINRNREMTLYNLRNCIALIRDKIEKLIIEIKKELH